MQSTLIISAALACAALVHADDAIIQAASRYETKGALDTALELLQDNLQSDDSIDGIRPLIDFVDRNITRLSRENIRGEISHFEKPEYDPSIWNIAGSALAEILTTGSCIVTGFATVYDKDRKEREIAANMPSPSRPSKEEAARVLEQYDILKKAVSCMETTTKAKMLSIAGDEEEEDRWLDVWRQVKQLKAKMKEARTQYLSYMVVSPCFWEVERMLYLSDGIFSSDKEKIEAAVSDLSHSSHKVWLCECEESVRAQFYGIKRQINKLCSEAVRKELEVLGTLLDSNDPSKKMGADAWMP
ncbi:MAG: hypothetical protein Q4F30_05850 [Akkermansia sp.]|nr:hypothetical protein [Akkermansia sp.]